MLTDKETKFIQYYKLNRNGAESVRLAGYKCNGKTRSQAAVIACQMLKKPHIKEILNLTEINQAIINDLAKPIKLPSVSIPTRDQYITKALSRASDDSKMKDDTKYKYFELAGKVMGMFDEGSKTQIMIYNSPDSTENLVTMKDKIKELDVDETKQLS